MTLYRDQKLSPDNNRLWISYRYDLKIRNLSSHTVMNYYQSLYAADQYFNKPLEELTKLDIKAFVSDSLDRLKDTTVNIHFTGLKLFYRWMVKEGLISQSPMDGIKEPTVTDNPPRIAPVSDIQALLKSCSGTSFRDRRDNALFRLMLEPGGIRRAETIGITVPDVDLDSELILIHGKGSKDRFLPYGAKTGQSLMRYLHVRKSHKYASDPALWLGRFGPLGIWSLGQILETRCKQAGIEKINPHGLRHSAADRAMAGGISDLDMQSLFGWKSSRMLAVYARSNRTARAISSARAKALGDQL